MKYSKWIEMERHCLHSWPIQMRRFDVGQEDDAMHSQAALLKDCHCNQTKKIEMNIS